VSNTSTKFHRQDIEMKRHDFVHHDFIKPHFSTKIWRAYSLYLGKYYNSNIFREICEELRVPEEYLIGDDNWVSNEFAQKFLESLIKRTGHEKVAESIGEFSLTPESINSFENAFIKALPPFFFYLLLPAQSRKVNQINNFKVISARPGHVKYQMSLKDPSEVSTIAVCDNTVGILKSTKDVYGLDAAEVKHTSCIHQGDDQCIFEIKYKSFKFWLKRIWLFIALGALASFSLNGSSLISEVVPSTATPILFYIAVFSVLILFFTIMKLKALIKHNFDYYAQTKEKNTALYESKKKLDRRYQESNLLRNLSFKLVTLTDSREVIKTCLNEIEERFGYSRILAMIVDKSRKKLVTIDVRGFSELNKNIYHLEFDYPSPSDNPGVFANILERGEATLILDIEEYSAKLKKDNSALITMLGVSSLAISPIGDSNEKYGILAFGTIGQDRKLNQDDLHLIENISRMLSLYFKNAQNIEKERTMKETFEKYVPAPVLEAVNKLTNGRLLAPTFMEIASMFIDLRGFTTLSEEYSPHRVVELLNIYFEFVTKYIAKHGGIVDNLIGDGVVAFFSGSSEQIARNALFAGIEILANLDELQKSLRDKGLPTPSIGIGLHIGPAVVGSIGSRTKMSYTAIGDTVNIASRIQDKTKDFIDAKADDNGTMIVTAELLSHINVFNDFRKIGALKLKGRKADIDCFLIDKKKAEEVVNGPLKQSA
jgi:class 3 adenylate cyclase